MAPKDSLADDQPILISLLLAHELIPAGKGDERIAAILREQAKSNCTLEEAVITLGVASGEAISELYAEEMELPLYDPAKDTLLADEELKKRLPEKFMRANYALPLNPHDGKLRVAFLNPTDLVLLQQIQLYVGIDIDMVVAPLGAIQAGLDGLYGVSSAAKQLAQDAQLDVGGKDDRKDEKPEGDVLDLDRVIPESKDTKIIRMVNQILTQAIRDRASDIHLEPYPEYVKIRLRVDGVLNDIPAPPTNLFPSLISRFKILAKMDIAEKRIPLDGAFSMKLGENTIDMRVSTIPTVHGEKMVMRLLNKQAVPLQLESLGFDARQCGDFLEAAKSPHGLLFVTGPTGSGKSTTLYATLNLVMSPKKNILTVEDPVEYKFNGINQVQVKTQVDLTFARALRAFLRQDPDVIMVGEVRDSETAEICLRAALTGHFVLSTIHTNDALSATTRLMDMGIEPFLIASTLRLVEAQRLIRRLCPKCKEPYTPNSQTIDKHGFTKNDVLFRPKGCTECRGIGYKGRVGLFEVIRITPLLRDMIQERVPLPKMADAARAEGMQTLADNGLIKVRQGITSLEEVVTVTMEQQGSAPLAKAAPLPPAPAPGEN